jgi:hypothetical protein
LTDRSKLRHEGLDREGSRREVLVVLALCAAASLAAILWSWQNGALLNYGDAVAHLAIARRVLDSRLPRFSELGSVWLPLPHILMLPFVQVYGWWANGLAAVLPSALAYLLSCIGLYRLARRWLSVPAAAIALVFFAANPNLLYLQTTAMTEPLFICEMIWIVFWLAEWRASLDTAPEKTARLQALIAAALIAAVFTRYDGWIIAFLAWTGIGLTHLRQVPHPFRVSGGMGGNRSGLRSPAFWLLSAFVVAAPLSWFAYNSLAFHDWLYFQRGPYSALAIEIRTATPGFPPHPGWHNPWVALLFYLKAAELDSVTARGLWGNLMLAVSTLGLSCAWITARRRAFAWALLLWIPIPFYSYSVAYGSVPIFLPPWWPHSHYNLRYGLEILPALALGLGFATQFVLAAIFEFKPRPRNHPSATVVVALLLGALAFNVTTMLRERPLVYVEGTKNKQAHLPYETQIPPILRTLLASRPGAPVLMITSYNPEIVALTGIPLRQTINESDLQIYTAALAAPSACAPIVLALDGDEIDQAVRAHPQGLTVYQRLTAPGQPSATIYLSDSPHSSPLTNPPAQ